MKLGVDKNLPVFLLGGVLVCLPFVAGFVTPGMVVVGGGGAPPRYFSTLPKSRSTGAPIPRGNSRDASTSLAMSPVVPDTIELISSGSFTSSPLFLYFMQSLISNGVPTFFVLVTVFFTAKLFRDSKRRGEEDDIFGGDTAISELYTDLYGDSKKNKDPFAFMSSRSPKPGRNLGVPQQEYIKIRSWNQKLDSYQYSVTAATKSKAVAAAEYRDKSFNRALRKSLQGTDSTNSNDANASSLLSSIKMKLLRVEEAFLKQGVPLVQELQSLQAELAKITIDSEMKKMGMDDTRTLDPAPVEESTGNATDNSAVAAGEMDNNRTTSSSSTQSSIFRGGKSDRSKSKLLKEIGKVQMEITRLELAFVSAVVSAVGTERSGGVRAALLGDIAARGTGSGRLLTQLQERPLSAMLDGGGSDSNSIGGGGGGGMSTKKSVFVAQFRGDVTASQVNELREEVTAMVRSSKPGDEALIVLQTGGGTVTGYGLAAAQLLRLKNSGLKLTIAVEQVAASGGYMMSCVADRIVASPMAVLGSIGVITEIPNVYERLKKEGIEFQTVTAGEFKRTLTPTKKITVEDIKKTKEDVEGILKLFRNFVKENRPQLDIEKVATGETWFGKDALDRGLCDELKTVDEVMMEFVDLGYDVYEVEYAPPMESLQGLGGLFSPAGRGISSMESDGSGDTFVRRGIRWLIRTMASEVRAELGQLEQQPLGRQQQRYMAQDDWSERVRAQDDYYN